MGLHMSSCSDRIEGQILLKAPRSWVWRALANVEEFDAWFGVALKGGVFMDGQRLQGHVTYPGHEHVIFEVLIERLEPQLHLSWRGHPAAIDRGVDYSQKATTLVAFELQEADGGTSLNLVESGFDEVPPERRLRAFCMNCDGWDAQMQNIKTHVAAT